VLRIIIIIIVIIIIESGRWLGKKKARTRAATASPATVCVVHYPKMQPITTPGTPAATDYQSTKEESREKTERKRSIRIGRGQEEGEDEKREGI